MRGSKRVEPGPYVILEGLFTLHWEELRRVIDTKVFVAAPLDVCFARRLHRDVVERGRTPESVYAQYEATVRPSAERYILPSSVHADVVVSGEQPLENSAAAVLSRIRKATCA